MITETAKITGSTVETLARTGEEFIEVEVTYTLGDTTEVCKYGYPLDTTPKQVEKDLKAKLATRKVDREHAERQAKEAEATAEVTKAKAKANKTVAALDGVTVK